MNPLAPISNQVIVHRLGVTLLLFLWQGALIAALYAAARSLIPSAMSRARYAAGCLALAACLLVPAVTYWKMSGNERGALEAASSVARSVSLTASPADVLPTIVSSTPRLKRTVAAIEPWLVTLWAAGVALLLARFLLGWAATDQLRRRWIVQPPAAWTEVLETLARRMSLERPVALLQSAAVRVPAALGVLRPVILFPLQSLSGLSQDQIEALLAHELAHVARRDYLINLMQSAAETLLFYHPAVWWISATIRCEREHCCDDLAVAMTGDAGRYAGALLELEQVRAAIPQFSLAATGGSLWKRIARLLPAAEPVSAARRSGSALLAVVLLALLTTAARLTLSSPPESAGAAAQAAATSIPSPSLVAIQESPAVAAPTAPRAARRETVATEATRVARLSVESQASPAETESAEEQPEQSQNASSGAALSDDQQRELEVHGVTSEFIHEITQLGYARASVDTLVALRIHGVDPEFIRRTNELFERRVSLDECVDLRIHGVTPDFVAQMFQAFGKISPDTVESLRIHGVTSEYLDHLHQAGFAALSPDEVLALRIHGVDPREATAFEALGLPKPSLDQLLEARIHGVSADYARALGEAGLTHLSLDQSVALRIHGVTPDFLRGLAAVGLSPLSADQAVSLRNQGVDAAYIRALDDLGYKGLSVDTWIALRNHGVTADFVRRANAKVSSRLTPDELIEWRNHGRE